MTTRRDRAHAAHRRRSEHYSLILRCLLAAVMLAAALRRVIRDRRQIEQTATVQGAYNAGQ